MTHDCLPHPGARPRLYRVRGLAVGFGVGLAACLVLVPRPAPAADPETTRAAEAIEKALQAHGPEVHRCFEKALADRLDVAGEVEVEIAVKAGGKVAQAKVASGAGVPKTLATCVREQALTWTIAGIEPGASVVLPFSFTGQANQFVIKAEDVPFLGPKSVGRRAPPFRVRVLADPVNVRAPNASMTLLEVGPASRVAMHRHPRSAKIVYVLQGKARLLGPSGTKPVVTKPGTAIFLPVGYPHVIENLGRKTPAIFLQVFSPPGPERVYRDPRNPEARVDFEVIRNAARVKVPPGDKPVVIATDEVKPVRLAGSKGRARVVFEEKTTGSSALSLVLLDLPAGAEMPRQAHTVSSELLYVASGQGKLKVGSEEMTFGHDTALYIPPNQPHAVIGGRGGDTVAVQIFAPAGPEQRYRGAMPPATKHAAEKPSP